MRNRRAECNECKEGNEFHHEVGKQPTKLKNGQNGMSVSKIKMSVKFVVLAGIAAMVAGHGSVVRPLPRQSIDADTAPYNESSVPEPLPPVSAGNLAGTWCPISGGPGRAEKVGDLAQSCFWFSNGCAPGCSVCDGSTRGPEVGPEKRKVCYEGSGISGTPMNATVCDRAKRTINIGAECGSTEDRH